MRPERVDSRVERGVRAHQGLERHRAGDVGHAREPSRIEDREGAQAGHEMRAVEERQAFLGLEDERPEAGARERLGGRNLTVAVRDRALADQTERHVGERRKISRRPDRPELGHDRMDAPVQARDHRLDHRGPHAGRAARERGREQQHDRADLDVRERSYSRQAHVHELVCPRAVLDTGATTTAHPLQAAMAVLATSPVAARRLQERHNAWLRFHAFDVLRAGS